MKNTANRTELARRESNGIEVSLYWSKSTNGVTVEVFDSVMQERFGIEVDPAHALDAFHHPFAYAASEDVVRLYSPDALAA